ncbi:hypothetical protein GQX73_g5629 [Xylaria multiplex]|uniref:PSI domain-containing protein n=1 Tax=Xylaria multiplex TaxID=323545 RepID=A0A7C8IRI4_9PEZI|nr:hypothetical protein GQX73_g5629 [Xylaria multiplex]
MQFSTTLSLFFVALVAAAPSPSHGDADMQTRGLVTFVMTEPNCEALKEYCTHCNGDFNCETDPRCEWCYEHKKFGPDEDN